MNLFWRIWLWFWLAMVLLGLSFFAAHRQWFADDRSDARLLELVGDAALPLARRDDPERFNQWRERIERRAHGRLFVLGPDGLDAGGRPLPPPLAELLHETPAGETDTRRSWRRHELLVLAPLADGYRAAAILRPGGGRFGGVPGWARLGIALVVSGLVCLALAFWLTRPVRKVREATMQLADGNLSVRVGDQVGRRRDEIARLAHDFDRMAERLETSIDAQRQLLRDVSHELRSPLARLQVAVELARGDGDRSPQHLDRMVREIERLDTLIGQVLTLARFDAGDRAGPFERIDLAGLLHGIVDDANFEAGQDDRRVRLEAPDELWIEGDEHLLRAAIENVVRNAVRHTAQETTVEVELAVRDGACEVTVRDHGPGVAEQDLERIFEPFVRVGEARDRDSGGLGIGLAIARRAVLLHGGDITANAVNGGLAVCLRLPSTPRTAPP